MDTVKEFAPIFWFHQNETYLPIDVQAMTRISDLYKKDEKLLFKHTIQELKGLGKDYCLSLKDINLGYPDPNKDIITSPHGSGPNAVSEHIKQLYNSIKSSYDHIIYTRSGTETIKKSDFDANVWSGTWAPYNSKIPGGYSVIQYFPFYVYNDFMNKHVGDWDSTVEIFINKTQNLTWVRTYMHHYAWFSSMGKSNQFQNINNWLKMWQNLGNGDLGPIFNLNEHPFIFVSLGSHGCYPTPGYTLYGIEVKIKLIDTELIQWVALADERQIGKVCLIPGDSEITKEDIKVCLRNSKFNTEKLKVYKYKLDPADNQPWSTFKGRWGNRSKLLGWDSPDSAPNKETFQITKNIILKKLQLELKTGYKPFFIIQNYHGLL